MLELMRDPLELADTAEAGLIALRSIQAPRVDLLGIYPDAESVVAQLVVLALVIVGFVFNHYSARWAKNRKPRSLMG